ncbi:MAG: hypothetical protein WDO18_21310 [Acidobacteriota bacterium]
MRYWGYLAAKFLGASLVLGGIGAAVAAWLPEPRSVLYVGNAYGALGYSILLMVYAIFCSAILGGIIWDHRLRCRTCFRRLRMPLTTGTWQVLMSRPRTEYICPYGHGTLKVEELQITGHAEPDWQPHDDMWKELLKK